MVIGSAASVLDQSDCASGSRNVRNVQVASPLWFPWGDFGDGVIT